MFGAGLKSHFPLFPWSDSLFAMENFFSLVFSWRIHIPHVVQWLSAERSFRPLDPCCLFPDIRAEGKHNAIQHTMLTKHNTTHCTQQNIRAEGTHNLSFNVNISFHHQSQCFHNTSRLPSIPLKTRKIYFSKFLGVSLILSKDHIENVLSKEEKKERQMALCPSTDV